MKTIPIKVFPKNTLIKYFPMNNVEFKIGRIKSCRIISTDDFIKYMSDKTILDTAGLMIRR